MPEGIVLFYVVILVQSEEGYRLMQVLVIIDIYLAYQLIGFERFITILILIDMDAYSLEGKDHGGVMDLPSLRTE